MSAEGTATLNPPPPVREARETRPLLDTEQLQEKVRTVKNRAKNLYELNKDRVVEWEEGVEGYVRERPLKSMAIAAGVGAGIGLIVGLFLFRR